MLITLSALANCPLSLLHLFKLGIPSIPLLQGRKLRLRESEQLIQDQTASKRQPVPVPHCGFHHGILVACAHLKQVWGG